jgi:hypothetical protein
VIAVIYRLDISSTWAVNPPGADTTGYNPILREPIIKRVSGARTVTRAEMTPVYVPCQVETMTFEQLQATFGGDNPAIDMALVCHHKDLATLGLLDNNKRCTLKPGDRIDHLEKNGRTIRDFIEPIYIYEVRPKSWGFGPDGYDLEVLYTSCRSVDPRRPT